MDAEVFTQKPSTARSPVTVFAGTEELLANTAGAVRKIKLKGAMIQ
jgi:hypothetical protein